LQSEISEPVLGVI